MLDSPAMRNFAFSLLGTLFLALPSCGPEVLTEEDRLAITSTLEAYIPALAEGYTSGNLEPLKEFAAEREVARVYSRVAELAEEGKFLEATYRQMTVEQILVWGHANAAVTTLEVWDLRVYTSGSQVLLGEELDQSNRVKYQLKKRGKRWEILMRELEQAIR